MKIIQIFFLMATPTLVGVTNWDKGVPATEAGFNIGSFEQSWENTKLYAMDRFEGRVGFAHDYDPFSTETVTGESNAATLDIFGGFAFGVAETIANETDGYDVAAGGAYMDDFSLSAERGAWLTGTGNFTRLPEIA